MTASVFARPQPQAAAMAGINITPLVDVMLVLLVIFMVTMPIRSESIDLTLPGTIDVQPVPRPEPVQLQVQADGSALLDGVRVDHGFERGGVAVGERVVLAGHCPRPWRRHPPTPLCRAPGTDTSTATPSCGRSPSPPRRARPHAPTRCAGP